MKFKISGRLCSLGVALFLFIVMNPDENYASDVKDFTNKAGMTFVRIPAGTFLMGSPIDEPGRHNTETLHEVSISRDFFIQITEVTQQQWIQVMGNNPSDHTGENLPVERVSWLDVQEFIQKLNAGENTYMYRLPTEAEWEYAARGGQLTSILSPLVKVLPAIKQNRGCLTYPWCIAGAGTLRSR